MKEISHIFQNRISSGGRPEKAAWLEKYIKHDIISKGTGIPEIRNILQESEDQFNLTGMPFTMQVELVSDLMRQKYTEDKLAAILYLQLFWSEKYTSEKIDLISGWFNESLITDWNVCDWLCVRILTPMLDQSPPVILPALVNWNCHQNPWKARASLVPFAPCKTIGNHRESITFLSQTLIKREERFCKTAVGWVLREYSKIDKDFVMQFLKDHEDWTTKEVIRNATKYMIK